MQEYGTGFAQLEELAISRSTKRHRVSTKKGRPQAALYVRRKGRH
jgi:hypothetical protein